jgi:hypothetical protein
MADFPLARARMIMGVIVQERQAATKTLRFRILSAPARLVSHARRRILKIPPGWEWSGDLATAGDRLQALHPA